MNTVPIEKQLMGKKIRWKQGILNHPFFFKDLEMLSGVLYLW